MLDVFLKYIKDNNLISHNQKILLTISGGIDSMLMLDLFRKTDYDFSVANCNFTLRGKESDDDSKFVMNFCKENKIEFFHKKFDAKMIAKQEKKTIQETARNLRYSWFREVKNKNNFDLIATAHHFDDVLESFYINLLRGTGIAGLVSLKNKNIEIIRPLLFATKEEIKIQAKNNIKFREDSSNKKETYTRNYIRSNIIPKLSSIRKDFYNTQKRNVKILQETSQIFQEKINDVKQNIVKKINNQTLINIKKLEQLQCQTTYLFEFLKKFEFNSDTCSKIINNLKKESGKKFYSSTHILIKDRENLIVEKIVNKQTEEYIVNNFDDLSNLSVKINYLIKKKDKEFKIITDEKLAQLDFDKIFFPIKIRRWHKKDKFFPLGMKNKKLLSDFFIDQKINLLEKEKQWILLSEEKIVWILGQRIDDRFKISNKTKKILELRI